ncbi:cysteine desulfurase family protein [Methylobrevis albus]|uniref:Cysteine desulfurase n=1 Tax=Methylobrevis albus TaxID=2793297 RepID=A0A931N0V0_9HYPH|nr:aminotransferase class V-fold PLP-dependent enzyme [Methylobrevis albus]MBH0239156.1 aminotransferase class V-fold PLP-dependent enzyme [Methylobrevis albus]
MPEPRLYLDHNAGAPLRDCARAAMIDALGRAGNPSSVHGEGRLARATVAAARRAVAGLVGAAPATVTFTSGGSEAAATLLTPDWSYAGKPVRFDRLLVSAIEHAAVLKGGRFAPAAVEQVAVDRAGRLDLAALGSRLAAASEAGERVLVALMLANNETGVIQPVAEAAALVHAAGGLLVCDAVQAAGRIPVDLGALGADALLLSAHKFGGPQGAGAIVRASELWSFAPLVTGGGQETYARAGTENVAAIAGFGAAATAAAAEVATDGWDGRRERLEAAVLTATPDAVVFGAGAERLPNTLCFGVSGLGAEKATIAFDLAGIAVSSGSACSSGKVGPSHVLAAMGFDHDMARSGIRVSFGLSTTDADLERFLVVWRRIGADFSRSAAPGNGDMSPRTGVRAA